MTNLQLKEWMMPVWQGGCIWEESVCFFEDAAGEIKGGRLLYAPEKISRITNHDGTVEYEEHRDYERTEYGILRAKDSRIPVLKREEYCEAYTGQPWADWLCLPDKERFIRILTEVYRSQILVTYEAAGDWTGIIPERQGEGLANTYEKLEKDEPLHIVFYGDSITAGWEASGANEPAVDMGSLEPIKVKSDRYPNVPVWAELVTAKLRESFPQAAITKDNLSAGGSTAKWGAEHVNELFDRVETPDLVFIGFGMNCMWDPVEMFMGYIETMIGELHKRNPNCEFVLYPAMTANPEMEAYQNRNMLIYEKALEEYATKQSGVIAAPVYSMFTEIEKRGKEYYEISGNCVNHPNDFSIRVYGQTIWETMCK